MYVLFLLVTDVAADTTREIAESAFTTLTSGVISRFFSVFTEVSENKTSGKLIPYATLAQGPAGGAAGSLSHGAGGCG
jgi:hypothetical protein